MSVVSSSLKWALSQIMSVCFSLETLADVFLFDFHEKTGELNSMKLLTTLADITVDSRYCISKISQMQDGDRLYHTFSFTFHEEKGELNLMKLWPKLADRNIGLLMFRFFAVLRNRPFLTLLPQSIQNFIFSITLLTLILFIKINCHGDWVWAV